MDNRAKVQEEALAVIEKNHRCSIIGSVGIGKTLIAILDIKKNFEVNKDYKCLVVVPKLSIQHAWILEFKKHNLEYLLDCVTFSTYISLKKQKIEYDCVYLDEAHSLLQTHLTFLLKYNNRIVGLTGTPPRHENSKKGIIFNTFCPPKYFYNIEDAVANNIINDYEIRVHYLKLDDSKYFKVSEIMNSKNKKWSSTEKKLYDYWNKKVLDAVKEHEKTLFRILRMTALMRFRTKEKFAKRLLFEESKNSKCILFANTTDQADRICEYSYHSKNKKSNENLELFKEGSIKSLSCVNQLSEGVSIPNLEKGIIMHAYGNERKSIQRLGRLLRLKPDQKAIIHILCYKDTVDETWLENALLELDQSKIKFFKHYE